MLGTRDPQRNLFAADTILGQDQLDRLGFYAQLAREGWRIFKDEEFSSLYCADNGRPSFPPSVLALATLLQFHDGVSDAEVVERCRFDLRWKAALHLDAYSIEAPFAKSTFQAFRSRLILHEEEGRIFEASIRVARDAGLLPKTLRLSLDSSPVRGRGAVKDTYNLLSEAIRQVLRRIAKEEGRKVEEVASEADLDRHVLAPSVKGSVEMDWSKEEEVRAFLAGLLADCDRAVELAKRADCEGEETKLLEQVIRQDVDREGEDGTPRVRRGVEKGRVPSVADPDVRHGHKSNGKGYTGHKAHVAVTQTGVITHVDVTEPSTPEGTKVSEAIGETERITGSEVKEALGDSAYGTSGAVQQAEECGVPIRTKMPSSPRGQFGPGDFEVSEDGTRATCPAGHESGKLRQSGGRYFHEWPEKVCGACPLREDCTKAKRRTLTVAPNFHDRREREAYARSSEGRQHLRLRVVVEHAIGRLKHRGAGHSRYFGRVKTRVQWLMTAAVTNLSLAWNPQMATAAN
jgi:transposase